MNYSTYIFAALGVAGVAALAALRVLVELGFGPQGAIWLRGVPLEYVTLVWFAGLFAILLDGGAEPRSRGAANATYFWLWGAAGLGGIVWTIRGLFAGQRVTSLSWTYWFAWSCIGGVFLLGAVIDITRTGEMPKRAGPDLRRIARRPATWVLGLGMLAILAVGPRNPTVPRGGAAFTRWYQRQTKLAVPDRWRTAPLTLVEMIDYQCPVCRYTAESYREVIRQAQATYSSRFEFLTIDFPLESECNFSWRAQKVTLHPAACEAAAVVRVARASGPAEERRVVEWLWNHQHELNPETIFDRVAYLFDLHVRELYPDLLVAIRDEAAVGEQLHVWGTPTLFLNGRQLPLVAPQVMQQAIALEAQALDRP